MVWVKPAIVELHIWQLNRPETRIRLHSRQLFRLWFHLHFKAICTKSGVLLSKYMLILLAAMSNELKSSASKEGTANY